MVDEAQQLGEEEILYMLSRLRSEAKMKSYARFTCNPDKKSYLRRWVDWYLLDSGLPDPDKCGVLRWFVMQDSTMHWFDSKEEAAERFPGSNPLSFTFIFANVLDNPVMMERQPEYISWLEGQSRINKEVLLYGNWDVELESSGFWKREWVDFLDKVPVYPRRRIRAWDLAAGVDSESYKPDYSAGVLLSQGVNDRHYVVEDVVRFKDRFAGVEQRLLAQAELDGRQTVIVIPVDPASAGKFYAAEMTSKLAAKGFTVRAKRPSRDKITRFGPFASVSEAGFVKIVNADWTEDYVQELEAFPEKCKHDDMVDATSDAFWALKQNMVLPTFRLPDLSRANPFAL